jgi:hypothetical protein
MVKDADLETERYRGKCRKWYLSHMQKGERNKPHFEHDGMNTWGKKFWNIVSEIGIRKVVGCTNEEYAETRSAFK